MAQANVRVGPYVLEGELGSGSMGAVWRARHSALGTHHALKLLRPELCRPADQARFRREIDLLAELNHPGLVRIHATDVDRGRLWYSMDLVEGVDLERMLVKGPLEHRLAVRIVRDVARAVHALHQRGVVHRDLKPANVVIDAQGNPRLVDLGLARAFVDERRRLTLTGEMVGTPYYMAPEQVRGQPATPGTDVWALGMLLYALLAGRPGWVGTTTAEVLEEVRAGKLVPLVRVVPKVSRKLAEVVGRALAKDPIDRWAGAGDLADSLDAWLRLTRDERRAEGARKVPLAAGVAVLVAGVGSALAVGILFVKGGGPASAASTASAGSLSTGAARSVAARNAREELVGLETLLLQGDPLPPGKLAALEMLRSELVQERTSSSAKSDQVVDLVQLEARLLIAEGELALGAGEATEARKRLDALEKLAEPRAGRALRELQREGAAGLRGGLALRDPRPGDDPMALMTDLTRQSDAAPLRADLRAWLIELALRCRPPRYKEAIEAVRRAPDSSRLSPELRAEAWMAGGRLDMAESLMPKLSPGLRGRLIWRLALRALEESRTTDALGLVEEGLRQAKEDPGRPAALEAARKLLERSQRWNRDGDPPEQLAVAIKAEIEATRVLKLLDASHKVDPARADDLKLALSAAAMALRRNPETVAIAAGLVEIASDLTQLYVLHAHLAVEYGSPDPRRDLKLIERGIEVARKAGEPDVAGVLTRYLAHAFHQQSRIDKLQAMVQQLDPAAPPEVRAAVLGRAGNLLRVNDRLDEARVLLEQARQLDPGAHEHVLFQHALERALFQRTQRAEHHTRAMELAYAWLEGWKEVDPEERQLPEIGKPGQLEEWGDGLSDVCGWLSYEEEKLGHVEKALTVLELLLRRRADEPRLLAQKLSILSRSEPLPAAALEEGLDGLLTGLDLCGDALAARAELEVTDADRNRLLRELAAGYYALMDVKHLEEALALSNAKAFRDGLDRLVQKVIELENRANRVR